MAAKQTDLAVAQASVNPKDRVNGQRISGEVEFAEAIYTMDGTETAGDVIDVVTLTQGAIVLPERSLIASEACGGTGTAVSKLGDASDDDRYSATSVALTSAAVIAVTPAVATAVITRTALAKSANTIKATLALSSGSTTAGKKVVFLIAWRMP